jgi:uncharacterized protein
MASNAGETPWERFCRTITDEASTPLPVFEVGIPVRDGVELAADVYLPAESDRPAPVIVQSTPYDKSNRAFFEHESRLYQEHGYVFLVHDVRGRGKSEGQWEAVVNDGPDVHDVIEWAAAQPWSTGNVGTTGLSYMGWTQWAAAAEHPPHLKAMVSTSAAGRWQQEIPYTNGCFQLYFGWWVYLVRRRITEFHGIGEIDWDEVLRRLPLNAIRDFINPAGSTWKNMVERDTLDDFWRSFRFDDRYDQIDVPCLHVSGWYDLEDLLGAFHHYEHMVKESPASDRQRLLVGPWSHVKSRFPHSSYADVELGPAAALDMDREHLRWFDHWLKGVENGVPDDPRVRIFEPGTNVWREASEWPLSSREDVLYLGFDGTNGSLSTRDPSSDEPVRSFSYDPNDPAPTQLDVRLYPIEDVPLNQTPVESRPDVITYVSEPLSEELAISGWPVLELHAATDGDDTDWHVKLTDIKPDGRSDRVTQGELRASYRDSLSDPAPVVPGAVHRYAVELWPTHHAFLPGHRIGVSITSSDFPWFARNLNRFEPVGTSADPRVAVNTVHHSAPAVSRIRLPVERGSLPG